MFIRKDYQQEYYQKNKKERLKYAREYHQKNKEYSRNYYKRYNEERREEVNERNREYNRDHKKERNKYQQKYFQKEENRERRREYMKSYAKDYYQSHRKECLDNLKRYFKTPKGRLALKTVRHNRRTISEKCSKLTIKKVQLVYERNISKYGRLVCALCNKPIKFGEDSLEHFIPLSRYEEFPYRDLNALNNLGISHRKCNSSKGTKTLEEWRNKNM